MYNNGLTDSYNYGSSVSNSATGVLVWTIICVVLAIVGGFVVYFLFSKKKNKFEGFLGKLHDFINFKKLLINEILQITYIMVTIFITLYSFALIGTSFIAFLLTLTLGNLGVRITYESILLMIKICENTSEINKKLK